MPLAPSRFVRFLRLGNACVGFGVWASLLLAPLLASAAPAVRLHFVDANGARSALDLERLRRDCGEMSVDVDDPYHGRPMRYLAIPLRCVLDLGLEVALSHVGPVSRAVR